MSSAQCEKNRFRRAFTFCLAIALWVTIPEARMHAADGAENIPAPTQRVSLGIQALMRQYDGATGLWNTEGWWNAANSVTVLADAASVDRTLVPPTVFQTTFQNAQDKFKLFRNKYYDDEGWWALAWIRAYDITGQSAYLSMAKSILEDMTSGWDATCGGGIWWNKDRHYKNAIANELFLSVAAGLAHRTTAAEARSYRQWANREWEWFEHSGMINNDGLINDGLTASCENNRRTTWSYNQGVVIGGLVELAADNRDPKLLEKAGAIARATLDHLTDADGVLHDPTEPHCSEDSVQFKGIFVRNLRHLYETAPNSRYATFFRANADSIWTQARTPENGVSCSWSGPPEDRGAGALTSALDTLVADAAANRDNRR